MKKASLVLLFSLFLVASVSAQSEILTTHNNETSGASTILDYSGNNFDGSVTNPSGIGYGVDGPYSIFDDRALSIESNSSAVNFGDKPKYSIWSLGSTGTVQLWVKLDREDVGFDGGDAFPIGINDQWAVHLENRNAGDGNVTPRMDLFGDNTLDEVGEIMPVNEWVRLTYSMNEAQDYLVTYMNGDLIGNTSTTDSSADDNYNNLCLGNRNPNADDFSCNPDPGKYFPGDIDEVRIYNDVRTSSEVSNTYTAQTENSAPSVSNPSPSDGATGVSTTTDLAVDVSDADGDSINVTFKWQNGSLIEKVTSVSSGSTVSTNSLSLASGTSYNWQVSVTDGTNTSSAGNYSFQTKVSTSASGYVSPVTENLFFRMNDSDSTITDFSGNSNTGTTVNSPNLGASGISRPQGFWDKGTAIQFDGGNGEYVNVSDPTGIPEGQEGDVFAISTWVNIDAFPTGGNTNQLMGYSDGNDGWFIQNECSSGTDSIECNSLKLRVYGENTGGLADDVFTSTGTWHHILIEWDTVNDQATIWVTPNSSSSINKVGTTTVTDTSTVPDTAPFKVGIGAPNSDDYFNGTIDEVKIINESVNSTEATNLFKTNSLRNQTKAESKYSSPQLSVNSPNNGETVIETLTSNVTPICFADCTKLEFKVNNGSKSFYQNTEQNAFSGPNNPSSVFVEEVNSTFLTWSGADLDPYVTYYNHSTHSWGSIVEAGDNPLTNDGHGAPALTVDQNGYIHIVFGSHNSNFEYVKSSSPYSVSGWNTQSAPTGTDTTYPNFVTLPDGTIYLFYRKSISNSDKPITFVKSSDGGSTWSSPREVVDFDTDNWMYVHRVFYDGNDNIWFSFLEDRQSTDRRRDAFTAYYDISTDSVKSVDGTDFGTTLTNQEARSSTAQIYSSPDGSQTNYIVSRLSPSGTPHTIFVSDASGTWDYLYSYWNGTRWTDPQTIATAADQFAHHDFIVNSEDNITAYLPISESGSRGGNITRWSFDGSSWTQEEVIADTNKLGGPFNDIKMTVNRSARISRKQNTLDYLFGQIDIDDFSNNDRSVFAYGSEGFVKRFDSTSYGAEKTINSVSNQTNEVFDFDFNANGFALDQQYKVRYTLTQNDSQSTSKDRKIFVQSQTAVDTTPPNSSDNWSAEGFVDKTEVNVELTATDDNSGVANISYQVNSGGFTTVSGSSTVVNINEQGNNTLDYYATDNAGNVESTNTEYVALNFVEPNIDLNEPADGGMYAYPDYESDVSIDFKWEIKAGTDDGNTTLYINGNQATTENFNKFDNSRFSYSESLSAGEYTYYIEAETDNFVKQSETQSFTVEKTSETRPELTLDIPENNRVYQFGPLESQAEVLFRYSINAGSENGTSEIYLDGSLVKSEPFTMGTSDTYTYRQNLSAGNYEYFVEADTPLYNVESFTRSFTVEQRPMNRPVFNLSNPENGSSIVTENATNYSVDFAGSVQAETNGTVDLELDKPGVNGFTSIGNFTVEAGKKTLFNVSENFTGIDFVVENPSFNASREYEWRLNFDSTDVNKSFESNISTFNFQDVEADPTEKATVGFLEGIGAYWDAFIRNSNFISKAFVGFMIVVSFGGLGYWLAGSTGAAISMTTTYLVATISGLFPGWLLLAIVISALAYIFMVKGGGD